MILIDFSAISVAAIAQELYRLPANSSIDDGYIRHLVINSLRSYRQKYHRQYGEIVICCDAKRYWRKDFFPEYKFNRKKMKEDSKVDWDVIHRGVDLVRNDLKEFFPYPVVMVDGAEGDDVIYTIIEWAQENDLQTTGMWEGTPKPHLIVSSDEDQIQTQRFPLVKQFSPNKKTFINSGDLNIEQFVNLHIAEGDDGDSIPNTLSQNDSFSNKIRQKSLRKDRKEEFITKGISACRDKDEETFYKRNQKLIDFRFIPLELKSSILSEFKEQKEKCDFRGRKRIMSYFIKNKMRAMIDFLSEF